MSRKKGIVSILLCGTVLLFTGCKEKPYDLTKEDQNRVTNYAAHIVTKHNRAQEEGLVKVEPEKLEMAEKKDSEETSKEANETQEKQDEKKQDEKNQKEGTQSKDNSSGDKTKTVSLQQALQLENGLKASFAGHEVMDSYVEEFFSMDAMEGKTYLVLHISLEAQGQDVECDLLSKNLKFRVIINEKKEVGAQTSILLNDLGTYQGKIVQGKVQDCILLFETEPENVKNIESLGLKVTNGTSSNVVKLQ
ncbi:MAG: hypothetical protein HFI37_09435 [Lachnospiraceae bacterium]|nr:hypothetical protein [Lachnospiraceae bacterium]